MNLSLNVLKRHINIDQSPSELRHLLDDIGIEVKRMEEQEKRHQGGNKWIGTGGTSPYGAYGYNPEGIRIGQDEGRNGQTESHHPSAFSQRLRTCMLRKLKPSRSGERYLASIGKLAPGCDEAMERPP